VCAGNALTLIVIVCIGCLSECVWWQIVTLPGAPVAPVAPVAPLMRGGVFVLLAKPTPTRTPDAARTAKATPIALWTRRL
jgi:hypothetical protein